MDGKQAVCYVVTTLLGIATFSVLPVNGDLTCPWCDPGMQSTLLDCLYNALIGRRELFRIPLQDIDNMKWQISSYSQSMDGLPYGEKKVEVDKKFVSEMTAIDAKNNPQKDPAFTSAVFESGGNCYSFVTGYDPSVINQDMKVLAVAVSGQNPAPQGGNPNPQPNTGMAYPANQNQQSNFQPQILPPFNNAPYNPPVLPPVNSYNNNPPVDNGPFNPPVLPPANSYNNNPSVDNGPFIPPIQPQINPSNNPSFINNAPGPSEYGPSNDYDGQGQAMTDSSNSQAQSDGSSGSDEEPQEYDDSSDYDDDYYYSPDYMTSVSPTVSYEYEDSKSTDLDSSDSSNGATPTPDADGSQKKTTEGDKSEDSVPCDEKFKKALYDKLINDDRFCAFFTKLSLSVTKPEVPKIMKHAFKEYGMEQHESQFSPLWRFESKTLNKESSAKDWDEVITKILYIIFSRNNMLEGDCEEAGQKIAGYILDTFPEDSEASSTEGTNQNDGNDGASSESNANSSAQETNSASNSTTNASAENNNNSDEPTDSENLSFPELHSKLSKMLNNHGSTDENGDEGPFSELLTAFENQQNLETLHSAAESCVSPKGFDFDKFFKTMSDVTKLIQKNHPDWSRDKCQKEMYAETVVVLSTVLHNKLKSSNNDGKSQSSPTQSDSAVGASDSESSDSGSQADAPNDYYVPSDYSAYPETGTDYGSASASQPQQGFSNYGDYSDGTGPANIPPYGDQPGPGDWNSGFAQPSNLGPGPVNPNYGDYSQSAPYVPSYDYPVVPPASMNPQPYPGTQSFPSNQNQRFQQPSLLPPNSGAVNPPNGNFGNNQYQARNVGNNNGFNSDPSGVQPAQPNSNFQNFPPQRSQDYNPAASPVIPNYNNQRQFDSNYNPRVPANGPVNRQW